MTGPAAGVSVVVMAYDEATSLAAVVQEIHEALTRLGRPFEVVVVDDGSRDGTGAEADRLAASLPGVRAIHHQANRGLGGVYRTGFAEARHDLVTFFPADGQFPATILEQFAPLSDDSDVVLGYVAPGRRSLVARLLSVAERVLYRLLFGPLPRFQGILMFRRALLQRFPLRSSGRGWAVLMELLIRAARAGSRIRSVPTAIRPRMAGRSKVQNPRTVWSNLRQIWALRRELR